MGNSLADAIRRAYGDGQEDEALEPIVAVDGSGLPLGRMEDGDYVIFYDIRGEREVELTQCLTEPEFPHFLRKKNTLLNFVTMIEYHSALKTRVAFPPESEIKGTLCEVLSDAGLKYLKISESEKAIHVGYFMNGKRETPFPGEERIVISSPEGISSYAETPSMSIDRVVDVLGEKLKDSKYRVLIANLANVDVIGHIEDRDAVIQAVEAVDSALEKIVADCRENNVTLAITADHGTVEEWHYPDGTINTGHTKSLVPFILLDFASEAPESSAVRLEGALTDVAPTVLDLLGVALPKEMTGASLVKEGMVPLEHSRVCLLILDGWGSRDIADGNMIEQASTPVFEHLWKTYPHSLLEASGESVGMPRGTVGNSEAGHLHIGAGRRIFLDRIRIDRAITDSSFFQNESFLWAMERVKSEGKALHLLGIVSFYSSHGTLDHLFALLELARKLDVKKTYVHSLIGRRGERPESGSIYISKVEEKCRELGTGSVVTVMGRHWALDREENWHLVERAYRALVQGVGIPWTIIP